MVAELLNGDEKKKECQCEHGTTLFWCGPGKNVPVMHFRADVCLYKSKDCSCTKIAQRSPGLTYKFVKTECRLLRQLLEGHGFREVHTNSNDFNVMWSGCHVKPYTLRGLTELQKVNHFPRSYEITRKDRLYKNVMRMRQTMGAKHFDFLPVTYVLPSEVNDFYSAFQREKGFWIAKPVASSRGRGISIISHPNQVCLEEQTVVCKYISNPLLVDGFKFDLRIYVMVTSFDPLRVYIFQEGLARFSTVRYDGSPLNLGNTFMHLTNYSINKKNRGYVKCSDPDIEDYGNKWSMSALLRYLKNEGYDTATMMMKIEDLIIKTLLSAEVPVANACRMFLPHRENCFELFGFDVILDEDCKPWLLEVNLSPSLACESPLDLKIKSNLCSHMFTLAGVVALDPFSKRETRSATRRTPTTKGPYSCTVDGNNVAQLSNEDLRLVRQTKEEFVRKGAFSRIFPTEDSWDLYGQFLENKTHYNFMLHSQLYPARFPFTHRAKEKTRPSSAVISMSKFRDISTMNSKFMNYSTIYNGIRDRYSRYEKSLQPLGCVEDYPPEALADAITPDFTVVTDDTTSDQSIARDEVLRDDVDSDTSSVPLAPVSNVPARAPSPPPVLPDVVTPADVLDKADHLTKVQARDAFATYLEKIQDKFNDDQNTDQNQEFYEEQMDVVVRFLKRASSNLTQQVFRVIVPSKKLQICDRRRILAKELGDFIHIYRKETGTIAQKVAMRRLLVHSKQDLVEDEVPDDILQKFLLAAQEPDLETLLTKYTSTHPSSALFFGELKQEDLACLIQNQKKKVPIPEPVKPEVEELSKELDQISIQERHFNHGKNANIITPTAKKPASNHSNHSTVTGSHIVNGYHGSHGNHSSTKANSAVNSNHGTFTTNGNSGNSTASKPNSNLQKQPSNGSNGSAVSLERSRQLIKSNSYSKQSVSTSSSGYGSSTSFKKNNRPASSTRPTSAKATTTSGNGSKATSNVASRKAIDAALSRLNKKQTKVDTTTQIEQQRQQELQHGRILKRTSTASSPYSRSTTSFHPPPRQTTSAKATLRPTKSDNHLRTAKSVSDVKTDRGNSVQASLKHSRSKRFVQSVWTKEFCKLMDLRMYNHP